MKFEIYIFGVTILQMEQKTNMNFDKYDWPCTFNFTYAQVYSITARGLGQGPSCCRRNVVKYHWGIQYVMEVRYQHHNHLVAEQATSNVLYKNSGLKVAQINCIRMEIVFCVPQQILLERTNFHLGPNSFYCGKMQYSVVYSTYWLTPWTLMCIQFGVSAILHNVLCGFGHVKDCLKSSIGL